MVMAVTAIAAIGTAVGTVATISAVAAAVAAVGVDLAVVGVVTKNQNLEKIGGVMALGGTAVGFAAGAGLFDAAAATTADAAGATGATAATDAATGAGVTASVNPDIPAWTSADTSAIPAASDANSVITNSGLNNAINTASGNGGLVGSAAPSVTDPSLSNPASTLNSPVANPSGSLAPASNYDIGLNGTPSGGVVNNQSLQDIINTSSNTGGPTTSWFNGLSADSKAMLGSALVQGGGMALGGLSSAYTAQQQLALNQLKNSQDFQKWQVANANANTAAKIVNNAPLGSTPPNLLSAPTSNGLIGSAGGIA